jgi:hypothetical protein
LVILRTLAVKQSGAFCTSSLCFDKVAAAVFPCVRADIAHSFIARESEFGGARSAPQHHDDREMHLRPAVFKLAHWCRLQDWCLFRCWVALGAVSFFGVFPPLKNSVFAASCRHPPAKKPKAGRRSTGPRWGGGGAFAVGQAVQRAPQKNREPRDRPSRAPRAHGVHAPTAGAVFFFIGGHWQKALGLKQTGTSAGRPIFWCPICCGAFCPLRFALRSRSRGLLSCFGGADRQEAAATNQQGTARRVETTRRTAATATTGPTN